jgi:hypothetical protein
VAAFAQPASTIERVSPERHREDFRILRGALEEGHPGIYQEALADDRVDDYSRAVVSFHLFLGARSAMQTIVKPYFLGSGIRQNSENLNSGEFSYPNLKA